MIPESPFTIVWPEQRKVTEKSFQQTAACSRRGKPEGQFRWLCRQRHLGQREQTGGIRTLRSRSQHTAPTGKLPCVIFTGLDFEFLQPAHGDVRRRCIGHGRRCLHRRMRDPELHAEFRLCVLLVLPAKPGIHLAFTVKLRWRPQPRRALVTRGMSEHRIGFVFADLQPGKGQCDIAQRIFCNERTEGRMTKRPPAQHERQTLVLRGCP